MDQNTLEVYGQYYFNSQPTTASFSLRISVIANSIRVAHQTCSTIATDVITILKKHLDEKTISTNSYNIQENYDWNNGTQKKTGYNVSTNITIKNTPLDTAPTVIEEAILSHDGFVFLHSFELEQQKHDSTVLFETAFENAAHKASLLAKNAQRELGRVLSITEIETGYRNNIFTSGAAVKAMSASSSAPMPIESGSQDYSGTLLRVVFELA